MNKILYGAALITGMVSVCWVGLGYVNTNPLALLMCVVMGAFYLMGVLELRRFGQATTSLSQ